MSRKYQFKDQQQLYFITYAVVHWIDLFTRNEYKEEVFTRNINRAILLNSFCFCEKKGFTGSCLGTDAQSFSYDLLLLRSNVSRCTTVELMQVATWGRCISQPSPTPYQPSMDQHA